jgi:hypothetical protein
MPDLGMLSTSQARTIDLMDRDPLNKSVKGWVAWANSDGVRQIVSDYFNIGEALQKGQIEVDRGLLIRLQYSVDTLCCVHLEKIM